MMIPLYFPVLAPILIACLGYFLPRSLFRFILIAFQFLQVAMVTVIFLTARRIGSLYEYLVEWPVGVGIVLRVDMLSGMMILLTAWMFLFLLLFNVRKLYMDNLFQFLFVSLQGMLIALFLSGDLFNVYVLMELNTLVIVVLIMYKRDKQTIYDGMIFIMINLVSMAFFLLGVGFVYKRMGYLDFGLMADIAAAAEDPRSLILPYALLMLPIGVKGAFFLLFAWLPRAHGAPSAPSIVSALLSGVQVKAGVYLFLRMQEIFGTIFPTEPFFLVVGFLTAITGFSLAIAQKDIKLILAYHTVSQVGLIMVGLNSGTEAAYWGGVYHIVNHAFFKALLFLTAGLIIKVYHTRTVTEVRGVFRRMPLVAIAGMAGVFGITGAPLFNGSVSKYLIQTAYVGRLSEIGIYLINLGTAISFVKFSTMFFGRFRVAHPTPDHVPEADPAHKPSRVGRQPDPFTSTVALVMGLACLTGGIAAKPIMTFLFGIDLSVAGAFYLQKTLIFLATVVVAILIYWFAIRSTHFLDRIKNFHFNFNDIAVAMLVFFVSLSGYLYLVV
jgi:multicomponent Na+:H+ antiporter subunit D